MRLDAAAAAPAPAQWMRAERTSAGSSSRMMLSHAALQRAGTEQAARFAPCLPSLEQLWRGRARGHAGEHAIHIAGDLCALRSSSAARRLRPATRCPPSAGRDASSRKRPDDRTSLAPGATAVADFGPWYPSLTTAL